MKYRIEIDGLKGIAILSIVFFHAGLNLFKGGFIGVDIFFVISGYLISNFLINNSIENKFAILNFYGNRIRKIFPVLFCDFNMCNIWMAIVNSKRNERFFTECFRCKFRCFKFIILD